LSTHPQTSLGLLPSSSGRSCEEECESEQDVDTDQQQSLEPRRLSIARDRIDDQGGADDRDQV
jgi:hypothetical protein